MQTFTDATLDISAEVRAALDPLQIGEIVRHFERGGWGCRSEWDRMRAGFDLLGCYDVAGLSRPRPGRSWAQRDAGGPGGRGVGRDKFPGLP
jgi:hypothetical protein